MEVQVLCFPCVNILAGKSCPLCPAWLGHLCWTTLAVFYSLTSPCRFCGIALFVSVFWALRKDFGLQVGLSVTQCFCLPWGLRRTLWLRPSPGLGLPYFPRSAALVSLSLLTHVLRLKWNFRRQIFFYHGVEIVSKQNYHNNLNSNKICFFVSLPREGKVTREHEHGRWVCGWQVCAACVCVSVCVCAFSSSIIGTEFQ